MELIVISYPEFFRGEADILARLLQEYNFTLHLRKPGGTMQQYKNILNNIPSHLHPRIMLHGGYKLAEKYEVKGLHFSTPERENAARYPDAYKSTSCHSPEEVKALHKQYGYLFLSPVFPSISKPGYSGNLELNEIKNVFRALHIRNVVALGGIDASKLEMVRDAGFYGAAVLGALWGNSPGDTSRVLSDMKHLIHG